MGHSGTMQAPDSVHDSKAEIGTVMTYRSLRDGDALREALLNDIPTVSYGDAFRGLGLTRVSFWTQHDPAAAVVRWEGTDIDTVLERFAASADPVLARWRGQLRMWSGPVEAESFWDASRHRLLSWGTGEQGAQSVVTVYRDTREIEMYRQRFVDFDRDPSLRKLLNRVRGRQGFTRLETWHQQANGSDLVLTLLEADDLSTAMAQLLSEDNELDKRLMDLLRSTILHPAAQSSSATLLARWHA